MVPQCSATASEALPRTHEMTLDVSHISWLHLRVVDNLIAALEQPRPLRNGRSDGPALASTGTMANSSSTRKLWTLVGSRNWHCGEARASLQA